MARRYGMQVSARAERQRAAELRRQAKDEAKRNELERARMHVEAFEASLEELKSYHREVVQEPDWLAIASSLEAPAPIVGRFHEVSARRRARLLEAFDPSYKSTADVALAVEDDAREFRVECDSHDRERRDRIEAVRLAKNVLAVDANAYMKILDGSPCRAELREAGGMVHFQLHNGGVLSCEYVAPDESIVPGELQSLTATGKVTTKPMPRAQASELYQDIVCSALLRIAREVFALLPFQHVLLTAIRLESGRRVPILSVIVDRARCARLPWDSLDPSNALDTFACRSDFKSTRRTGTFKEIRPWAPSDVPVVSTLAPLKELLERAQAFVDSSSDGA